MGRRGEMTPLQECRSGRRWDLSAWRPGQRIQVIGLAPRPSIGERARLDMHRHFPISQGGTGLHVNRHLLIVVMFFETTNKGD